MRYEIVINHTKTGAANFYVFDSQANDGRGKMLTQFAFGTIDDAMDHAESLERIWG
jgi:hypothetical protein